MAANSLGHAGLEMSSKFDQNEVKVGSKWSQNAAKSDSKWGKHGVHIFSQTAQNANMSRFALSV